MLDAYAITSIPRHSPGRETARVRKFRLLGRVKYMIQTVSSGVGVAGLACLVLAADQAFATNCDDYANGARTNPASVVLAEAAGSAPAFDCQALWDAVHHQEAHSGNPFEPLGFIAYSKALHVTKKILRTRPTLLRGTKLLDRFGGLHQRRLQNFSSTDSVVIGTQQSRGHTVYLHYEQRSSGEMSITRYILVNDPNETHEYAYDLNFQPEVRNIGAGHYSSGPLWWQEEAGDVSVQADLVGFKVLSAGWLIAPWLDASFHLKPKPAFGSGFSNGVGVIAAGLKWFSEPLMPPGYNISGSSYEPPPPPSSSTSSSSSGSGGPSIKLSQSWTDVGGNGHSGSTWAFPDTPCAQSTYNRPLSGTYYVTPEGGVHFRTRPEKTALPWNHAQGLGRNARVEGIGTAPGDRSACTDSWACVNAYIDGFGWQEGWVCLDWLKPL